MRLKVMILSVVAIVIVMSAASARGQDFFKGKTIQIILGYPTGGGVDAEGRLLGKYLERHFPGNPAVTVRNMPGAAGLVAANWFEQFAKPDGLHLYYGSSTNIVEQAFGREEVKYNPPEWGSCRRDVARHTGSSDASRQTRSFERRQAARGRFARG